MPIAALALLALVMPTQGQAGQSDWQEVAPDVRVRLIASDVREPDGTLRAALEIDMPEGVKTYWRVPGETGIPTEFDLSGSLGISGHEVHWPYPLADTKSGYLDYVYYGHTVLPFSVRLSDGPVRIEAMMVMGICSDVCVPVQARLSLPVDFETPDRASALRIRQAMAETPIDWTGPHPAIGPVEWSVRHDALAVSLQSPDIDPESIIVDAGARGPLFGAPQKSPDGNLVLLPLLGKHDAAGLEGKSINITFVTPAGAFEMSRRVAPAQSTRAGQ
ncbi:protein-disulfide reductase DsbD domain-containing protein [Arsenicitalea aurantiaca]|nr:protein-disulfide reductase DsbD domain-containing protein [Arsenicitalea aurantiaca]